MTPPHASDPVSGDAPASGTQASSYGPVHGRISASGSGPVLVIRLSSIGDIVLVTPFLRALRRARPDDDIHVAVRAAFAPLLAHHPSSPILHTLPDHPSLTDVLALRSRVRALRVTAVFDLHGTLRARILRTALGAPVSTVNKRTLARALLVRWKLDRFHDDVPVAERYLETGATLGLRSDGLPPDLHASPAAIAAVSRFRHEAAWGEGPFIALCPGARHATKRWPEEAWVELASRLLQETDAALLVLGGDEDAPAASAIRTLNGHLPHGHPRVHSLCGVLTLDESVAAMSLCSAAVSNDSGLMHVATGCGVPVVALFGSTVRQFGFFPYRAPSAVLEIENLPCRPCSHLGLPACPQQHFRCMRDLVPDRVIAALQSLVPSVFA